MLVVNLIEYTVSVSNSKCFGCVNILDESLNQVVIIQVVQNQMSFDFSRNFD